MSKIIEIKVPEFNDAKSASDAIYKLLNQAERIEEEATKIADHFNFRLVVLFNIRIVNQLANVIR